MPEQSPFDQLKATIADLSRERQFFDELVSDQSPRDRILDKYDRDLFRDIDKAEKNLTVNENDWYHTGVECRRFAERLAIAIIARERPSLLPNTYVRPGGVRIPLAKMTRLIQKERLADEWVIAKLDSIRDPGNAVHVDRSIGQREARLAVATCNELAKWFEAGIQRQSPKMMSFADFVVREGKRTEHSSSSKQDQAEGGSRKITRRWMAKALHLFGRLQKLR